MAKFIPKVVPEPIWETRTEPCTQFDLVRAFQWYNMNKDSKDARKYLIEYLEKNNKITLTQKKAAEYLNNSWNIVDGWLARCLMRGAWVPDNTYENFNRRIEEFKSRLNTIILQKDLFSPVKEEANVVSIQERVQQKVDYFIMELESTFDAFYHLGSLGSWNAYDWMTKNEVKPMHASKIAEYFRERTRAWVEIIENRRTDDYLKESYPKSDKIMIGAAKFLAGIADDADRLASNKNAARKPRKKKPISQEKKVGKLKYKVEDSDNKLVSINPIKILGSQQLWVYNVKSRKLGVYVAADQAGLGVKGSVIENYKYSDSIAKTLRKPKDVLPRVLDGGKIVLRKVMGEINSKSSELNGRINKDTILLRVE
jgi:hypothetical protein